MAEAYRLVALDIRVTDVSLDVPGANSGDLKNRATDRLAGPGRYTFVKGHRYYNPITASGRTLQRRRQNGIELLDTARLGVVIMNRNSGDWETFDADFRSRRLGAPPRAKRCVFYVKTQYGVAELPKD